VCTCKERCLGPSVRAFNEALRPVGSLALMTTRAWWEVVQAGAAQAWGSAMTKPSEQANRAFEQFDWWE